VGGKSHGSVNRMFLLTDSFVVRMIRRSHIFGTLRQAYKFIGSS